MTLSRRSSLQLLAAAPLASAAQDFTFVHFSDTHIQPELKAAQGCGDCFRAIQKLRPDFALAGGDLVFDACETSKQKAVDLFRLYQETVKHVEVPVYSVPGNHDVMGLSTKSGMTPADPTYGKRYFEEKIGRRYSSFNHKGWHFVLLDSIGITAERSFIGLIDDEQLSWLKADLAKTGPGKPIVMMTHIPVVSAVLQIVPDPWKTRETYLVTNSQVFLDLIAPYNVKAVLQGHTHIRETVTYNGCQFITSGAVCGNWWKGPRIGHPEGFGVLRVRNGALSWSYQTYGFVAQKS